uniref:Uncharacterized protein n=1 Tax=Chromera velia CCMP2878 TaxID=1169474 RepID=A0A0G4FTC3_9ALVE|eukprot:Cvel_3734.t1-p1 / transcript=Cvel_3734.t1 / gene=Cvel_3734 / organism=Chromera_velia_CCMP2878 / gene_product=Erythronolide synthase, modules 3 and 4, putative / transcript_product=Erythronolide synthase, modules 3 and 4, putative / location=Cvel_scaffold155:72973-88525(+) / protein_length=4498 / sequence_SO=supercontig / SO=protein_coding / is_pseudo=false
MEKQAVSDSCAENSPVDGDLANLWGKYGNSPFISQIQRLSQQLPGDPALSLLDVNAQIKKTLSFAEIYRDVARLSASLTQTLKLRKGDRVILCFPPGEGGMEFIVSFYACLSAGIVAVPVYPPEPSKAAADIDRFCDISAAAEARICLTNTAYNRVVTVLRTLSGDKRKGDFTWSSIQFVVSSGLIENSPLKVKEVDSFQPAPTTPKDVAFLQFTSGSTSAPKGVMVTHGSLLHNIHLIVLVFGFHSSLDDPTTHESARDFGLFRLDEFFEKRHSISHKARGHRVRIFSWLPLYHDMGLIAKVCAPFFFGLHLLLMSPLDFIRRPQNWLVGMSTHKAIVCAAPNFAFELAVKRTDDTVLSTLNLSHVCAFVCGAEPVRAATVDRFVQKFGTAGVMRWMVAPAFGLAESTLIVTGRPNDFTSARVLSVDADVLRVEGEVRLRLEGGDGPHESGRGRDGEGEVGKVVQLVSCGRAPGGVEVRIVDAEKTVEVPEGRVGEVWVLSDSNAAGYFGIDLEEKTEETFRGQCRLVDGSMTAGNYLRTGDSGFLLEGELYIVGRLKDMLIVRGRNYFPQDIEEAVEGVDAVRKGCSVCFPLEDAEGGERVGVAAELRDEAVGGGGSGFMGWLSRFGGGSSGSKLEAVRREIAGAVARKVGLSVHHIWLLKARQLPKTSSGKVRRRMTRDLLLSNQLEGVLGDGETEEIPVDVIEVKETGKETTEPSREEQQPNIPQIFPPLAPSPLLQPSAAPSSSSFQSAAAPPPSVSSAASPSNLMSLTRVQGGLPPFPSIPPRPREAASFGSRSPGASLWTHQTTLSPPQRRVGSRGGDISTEAGSGGFHPSVTDDKETREDREGGEVSEAAVRWRETVEAAVDAAARRVALRSVEGESGAAGVSLHDAGGDGRRGVLHEGAQAQMKLDADVPLHECGFDSIAAVEFSEDLGNTLGLELEPTLLFDYPTLNDVIDFLSQQWHSEGEGEGDAVGIKSCGDGRIAGGFVETKLDLSSDDDVIAIAGAACRLPGGVRCLGDFWDFLIGGREGVTDVPSSRWALNEFWDEDPDAPGKMYCRGGGFLEDVDLFDNEAFRISRAEATAMDPQQRLLLEIALEAFESGERMKKDLEKQHIGVFVGCCANDWQSLNRMGIGAARKGIQVVSPLVATSAASSMLANRLSYVFALKGPSWTVDSACSSSLVAVDQARVELERGTSTATLAAGVNLVLDPLVSVAFCKARMLAPDSRCKAFDALADGYVRGEGCCAVVMEKVSATNRRGGRVLGIVKGSATNHGGRAASLTAPNSHAQKEVLQAALESAKVPPWDIAFLEAHGTGTSLGDPIELSAVKQVFGRTRSSDRPLFIGALKTNIGHLEGAAGIAGLLKLLLVLIHRRVPPNLHFTTLNPKIDTKAFSFAIPIEPIPVHPRRSEDRLLGGVSSFGFGGANAHVVLEEAPPSVAARIPSPSDRKEWNHSSFPWTVLDSTTHEAQLMGGNNRGVENEETLDELRAMTPDQLKEHVTAVAVQTASQVLGQSASELPPLDAPLQELGIDSLGAVEFRNELQAKLGVRLPATALFDYPTLHEMREFICRLVNHPETAAVTTWEGTNAGRGALTRGGIMQVGEEGQVGVVGVSCRLPGGSTNPERFWEMMMGKTDCMSEVPLSRWNNEAVYDPDPDANGCLNVREAAFIEGVDLFDNGFFSISAAETKFMDPQQRHMLEVAYEAFCHAGQSRESLLGSDAGVFIGNCNNDWLYVGTSISSRGGSVGSALSGTGVNPALLSNRVSYCLGLKGPSMTVETACSASLVGLDSGIKSLRLGVSSLCLAGGVNLFLAPQAFIACCKARMLSTDSRCKTFDAAANGYARGEGVGAVVLQRLAEARAEKKPVFAIVRGSAVNHDGRSASLTAPNGPSQQDVIRSALLDGGVKPSHVCYVEAHGTGTALGDPIEVGALKAVYGVGREESMPLVVGAVKTNFGHLEGAAGIAGFIKLVLVLGQRRAPPNLHFKQLNPHIDVEGFPVLMPTEVTALGGERRGRKLIGAVSSFGFGGTNAHVVLEEGDRDVLLIKEDRGSTDEVPLVPRRKVAFMFTGQGSQYVGMCKGLYDSEEAFRVVVDRCGRLLEEKNEWDISLRQLLFPSSEAEKAAAEAKMHQTRFAQVALFAVECGLLALWRSKGVEPDVVMGHSLGEYPAAVASGVMSLEDGLILVARRAEAMQAAPPKDGVMAACRMSEEEVLEALESLQKNSSSGTAQLLADVAVAAVNGPKSIVLAGPRGGVEALLSHLGMSTRAKFLSVSHAFHSPLMRPAREGFEPLLSDTVGRLREPSEGVTLVSSVTGKAVSRGELTGAEHWLSQIERPVRFLEAVRTCVEILGCSIVAELGPQPVLVNMARSCVSATPAVASAQSAEVGSSSEKVAPESVKWLSSSRLLPTDTESFARAMSEAVSLLQEPSEAPVISKAADASQQNRSWAVQWARQAFPFAPNSHPFVGRLREDGEGGREFQSALRADVHRLIDDHQVKGKVLMPGAGFVEMMAACVSAGLKAAESSSSSSSPSEWAWARDRGALAPSPVCLMDVEIERPMVLPLSSDASASAQTESRRTVEVSLSSGRDVTVRSRVGLPGSSSGSGGADGAVAEEEEAEWEVHARCSFANPSGSEGVEFEREQEDLVGLRASMVKEEQFDAKEIYAAASRRGLSYGPRFQTMRGLWRGGTGENKEKKEEEAVLALLQLSGDSDSGSADVDRSFRLHPALLDGAFQAAGALLTNSEQSSTGSDAMSRVMVPVSLERALVGCLMATESEVFAHVKLLEHSSDSATFSLRLCTATGRTVAEITRLQVRPIDLRSLSVPRGLLWQVSWKFLFNAANGVMLPSETADHEASTPHPTQNLLFLSTPPPLVEKLLRSHPSSKVVPFGGMPDGMNLFRLLSDEQWAEVLYLGSLSARESSSEASDPASVVWECIQVLQALSSPEWPKDLPRPRVRLVTAGSQFFDDGSTVSEIEGGKGVSPSPPTGSLAAAPVHAGVLGLARTAGLELQASGVQVGSVDVDMSRGVGAGVAELVQMIESEASPMERASLTRFESEIALRKGKVFGARLMPRKPFQDAAGSLTAQTYLITGGLGGLGLVVVNWLLDEGAKRLVLVSRRSAPDAETAERPEMRRLQRAAAEGTVQVEVRSCDVSSAESCERLLEGVCGASLAGESLKQGEGAFGIVHAAGVLADAQVKDQTEEGVRRVYASKATEAWNLHRALQHQGLEDRLESFVMFSSSSSLLGNFGQANYSAANAALDALAAFRVRAGLRAVSIQWGPWEEQGMAPSVLGAYHLGGLVGLSNEVGLRVLGDVTRASLSSVTVPVVGCQQLKWKAFMRRYDEPPPFFEEVRKLVVSSSATGPSAEVQNLLRMMSTEQLREHVRGVALQTMSQVLGMSPSRLPPLDTPLQELGIDSLGGVEMRNELQDRLGVRIPATAVFENPTMEGMIEFICKLLKDQINAGTGEGRPAEEDRGEPTEESPSLRLHRAREAAHGFHPLDDVESLRNELSFDVSVLHPPTPAVRVRNVLLTGVTGLVGRFQLSALLESKACPTVRVHCLVRAPDQRAAMQRVRDALREAKIWKPSYEFRIVAVPGDFGLPLLGLSEEDFDRLCKQMDKVYHTGADVSLMGSYSRLRIPNLVGVKDVIKLCTTHRLKPLHFVSTLAMWPAVFALFSREFAGRTIPEDGSVPDPAEMQKHFPPDVVGYPWTKMTAEWLLQRAKELGLPIAIYRLPSLFLAWESGYTNTSKGDYAAAQAIASIQEGCFPIGVSGAPFTPVDTVAQMIVEASLLDKRLHWMYHLMNTRTFTGKEQERWAQSLGLSLKAKPIEEFEEAILKRQSAMAKFLPMMQYWRRYWFHIDKETEERRAPLPVMNRNIFEDLPHMRWPSGEETLTNSFIYCCQNHLYPSNSLALSLTPESVVDNAARGLAACGIDGPRLPEWIDTADAEALRRSGSDLEDADTLEQTPSFMPALARLCEAATADKSEEASAEASQGSAALSSISPALRLSFQGRFSLLTKARQMVMNLMFLAEAERRYPEIRSVDVAPPIVIIGVARVAGQILCRVLAEDPQNCAPAFCEMAAPYGADGIYLQLLDRPKELQAVAPSGCGWGFGHNRTEALRDPRTRFAREQLEFIHGRASSRDGEADWQRLKLFGPTLADEDSMILDHSFRTLSFALAFGVPEYRNWLKEGECLELQKVYRLHRRFLQHLQWQRSQRVGEKGRAGGPKKSKSVVARLGSKLGLAGGDTHVSASASAAAARGPGKQGPEGKTRRDPSELQQQTGGGGGPQRWVLKSPYHAASLGALFEEYPDATVVCVHRDLTAEATEWATTALTLRRGLFEGGQKAPESTGREELDTLRLLEASLQKYRQSHPERREQFIDVDFEDVMRNPLAVTEKIYKQLNLTLSKRAKTQMGEYLSELRPLKDEIISKRVGDGDSEETLSRVRLSKEIVANAFSDLDSWNRNQEEGREGDANTGEGRARSSSIRGSWSRMLSGLK